MIPLTPREFSLLDYLLRHPDRVCTREDLLEHVWDAHYDGVSNVVDVHIANLRRKLELADQPDPIETVRGVGYRLTEFDPSPSMPTGSATMLPSVHERGDGPLR